MKLLTKGRYFIETGVKVRMDVGQTDLHDDRSDVGTSQCGQVCIPKYYPTQGIQFILHRPLYVSSGCNESKLVQHQQLCESTLLYDWLSSEKNTRTKSAGYPDRTILAKPTMVSEIKEDVSESPSADSKQERCNEQMFNNTGTKVEHQVENLCLVTIWRGKLRQKNWSEEAIDRFVLNWSPTTLESYSRCVRKYVGFTLNNGLDPQFLPSSLVAEFFVKVAVNSDRPKSILDVNSAALTCYFAALDQPSPVDQDVRKLINGIVKSGTKEVMKRSSVMPREPFMNLFKSWPENDNLSLEFLRLKTLTLMSLVLMLRPLDVAPRALVIKDSGMQGVQFTADRIKKCVDGSLDVSLLGIKNDYSREGFVVNMHRALDPKVCPVEALLALLQRTKLMNDHPQRPVFTPINYPYSGLSSSSIAKVLRKAIDLAGLGNKGYSAKSFRPTGTTSAIEQGVNPDVVQKVGRWRSQQCFMEHYVHSRTSKTMSDYILLS